MKDRASASYFAFFLLILIASATLWLWSGYRAISPSDDGTRDLREAAFDSGAFDLFGAVEYIPNELLTPDEFEAKSDKILIGNPGSEVFYVTTRTRIYAPEGIYGLMLWKGEYATNIYINGQFMESTGSPAETTPPTDEGMELFFFSVETKDGMIEIVQQASTYIMQDNVSFANIIIGKQANIRKIYDRQKELSSVLMGCFLALALAHFALYYMLRARKVYLWFAFFCLAWFFRTGFSSPWVLSSFLSLPGIMVIRLCCLTVPAAVLFFCLAFHSLFPDKLHKNFRIALLAICSVFSIVYLFADMPFAIKAIPLFFIIVLLIAIYILMRMFLDPKKLFAEFFALFAGSLIFMFGVLWDIINLYAIPLRLPAETAASGLTFNLMAEFVLLAFVLFQMVILFHRTMQEVVAAKEAEQRLLMENTLLAHETKVREDMVRDLSHEIKTPLAVISTYAQLAMRQFKQGESYGQIMEGLDVISEEAQRIAKLAGSVLTKKDPDIRPADIGEIARQLVRLLSPMAQSAGREITTNITGRLFTTCNVGEITQIIWNLLDNALKHSGSGDIEVDGNMNDRNVYIIVSDYGEGIPHEILPTLFVRGVSGSGSSGIGLSIAEELAQKHGGKLLVESEYGMGTKATLVLPVSKIVVEESDE